MRKIYLLLFAVLFTVTGALAQVTVTGDGAGGSPYATLDLAIAAVNGVGTLTQPTTITTSISETAPAGGYQITAIGSATNTLIISGGGNTYTASNAHTAGNLNDAVFKLIGADFVTIQNFVIAENVANTTTAAATNNMTEWGIALLYASTTNGAQNNTIQNNTITLNRAYSNTFGIYSNTKHSATALTVAEATTAAGSNSNNRVYGNTINNVDKAISFTGANTAVAMDNGNDIGGTSALTGNTITNFGGLVSGVMSAYPSVNATVGIWMNCQVGENVSFNTVTSATNITTLTTTGFAGIIKGYTSQPTGLTFTSNYNNNTVTLTNAATTAQMTGMGLQGLTTLATATFNCNNNSIINCAQTGAGVLGATMLGMLHVSAPGTFNINGNTIRGFATNTTTTGGFVGIQQQTNGVVNALNINNNRIGDAIAGAVTFNNTTTTAGVTGIAVTSTGAASTCAVSINGNDIRGVNYITSGTGTHLYLSNAAISISSNINNNTFTNLNVNTTGSVTFIGNSTSLTATGSRTVNNNSIVTAFNKGGAGNTVTFFSSGSFSVNGSTNTFTGNNFSNVTVTGATTIAGWASTEGNTGTDAPAKTFTNNTFNNITGGTGSVTAVFFSFGGATNNISSNTITNITGQGAVTALNLGGSNNGFSVSQNTINNITSTGTGGVVIGIASSSSGLNIGNISNNRINGLSTTGSTASSINITGATLTNVFKNNIYDIVSTNTTPTVNGIVVGGGTTTNSYNNFISNLRAPNANAAVPIYGINVTGGTNAGVYYNTVALGRATTITSAGAQFGVTGIGYSSSTNTTLRNNIVWIDATPVGTGTVAAVRRSAAGTAGTAPSATNFNSNNNIYHVVLAPGTAPVAANINKYLYVEGTVATTATNGYGIDIGQADVPAQNLRSDVGFNTVCGLYKTFMGGRETATFSENNLTILTPITFAPAGSSFAAENAASIATPAITDDYNNVTRSATTPDIGALEFAGTGVDAAAPTISFTALANTVCTTAPTLSAVITDASGVNTTPGLAPRLYYRKGGATAEADVFGTYPADNNSTFNGWKYVEATGTAPNFSFAINYSLLTSPMVVGDSLTYFVVAQDLAGTPNVARNAVTFPSSFCPNSVVIPSTGAVPTSNSLGYRIVQISTVQPATTAVNAGTIDNQVLRIDIPASTCYGNITQLNFTNASTAVADISNARVYYTTTATFSTATLFGTAVANPGATFSVNGTQASAASGINYFWLVYDIACAAPATAGNVADASLVDAITTVAGSLTPSTTNPIGTRLINAFAAPTIATNQPASTSIPQGTTGVQVLRVDVPGSLCIGNITQLNFTNVSTNIADVTIARVFYTTTTTFSNAVQFGSNVVSPGATFSVTGSQASALTGTNYFWLVFDVSCAATIANTVDAGNTNVVTTLGTYTPATPNPPGTRAITALTSGDNIQTATVAVLGSAGGNPYDVAGKGIQLGEPSPMLNAQPVATNGAGTSNYSWGTAAGGTVWYRLDVPTTGYGSSGNLLIRATTPTTTPTADAQVALWKFPNMVPGGTCSDPANFTGGYMLAANDDGILTGTGYWGASASSLNAVIRVRLIPGQTYYVQIDGFGTGVPVGDLIIEDLADAAGKNVPNNGFGAIHNPTGVDMRFAAYEVVGDDGWTYYYSNNGTETNVADDQVLMGLNWSTSTSYLWNGTNATNNDLMNHVRRDAKSLTGPSTTAPGSATGTDAFAVWSGRNNAAAASADLKPTAPYVGTSVLNWWMMNKFWNVFPNVQPTTSIGVRYFYSDADFTALQTVVTGGGGALATATDMQMIKATRSSTTHYTNAEMDPASGHAAILNGTVTTPTWINTAGVQTGINQAQYSITTFSGGGGGSTGTTLIVLPVTLSNIRGEVTGATNTVYWTTATEVNNRKFVIERSTNGSNFTAIGDVVTRAINGNSSTALQYSFVDANPVQGKAFYRLQMVDNGGRATYSPIVTLRRGAGKLEIVDVRPNPTTGNVYFNVLGTSTNVNVAVRDLSGKEVIRKGLVQSNSFSIDMSKLANGMYILEAVDVRNGEKAVFKVMKQ